MRSLASRAAVGARPRLRPILLALVVAGAAAACGSPLPPAPSPSGSPAAVDPTPSPLPTAAAPTPSPTPAPSPSPVLVAAPLTGLLVAPELAARRPIAVMVDDHWAARPQSGFTEASVVWQAPAEGGIPRYMMVFAEGDPTSVGPVRSGRLYFVQWAAEWRAVYVHVGGSPQALAALRGQGQGQLVYDADQYNWGAYLWRAADRAAPHNVYSDGRRLRALAARVGAEPLEAAEPVWRFGPAADLDLRPAGARLETAYRYGAFSYRYDRPSNTWRRYVNGEVQRDRASERIVAPQNVVVMEVGFHLLGANQHGRLEAETIGSGRAWIATNGTIVRGTWEKASAASPTQFFDRAGEPVTLTRGQTFIQVVPSGTPVTVIHGRRVFDPAKAAEEGVR